MLILTRRVGQTLMIDHGNGKPPVEVTVLGVKGNQVRIGVKAEKDVAVHREEIYERIKKETDGNGIHKEAGRAPVKYAPPPLEAVSNGGRTILRTNSLSGGKP